MTPFEVVRQKYRMLKQSLNERSRRLWAAAEARALGYGGASLVVRATGISRSTIVRGMRDVDVRLQRGVFVVREPGGNERRRSIQA